jgi:tyrosinase
MIQILLLAVTQDCMSDQMYTGGDNGIPPGFGGPATDFSHQGGTSGGLESNPHNLVRLLFPLSYKAAF